MKLKKSSIYVFLWLVLSTGLLVFNQFLSLQIAVLYGIVPGVFLVVILMEASLRSHNPVISYLIAFTIWSAMSIFYTVNYELTTNYLSVLLGNIVLWFTVSRIVEKSQQQQILLMLFIGPLLFHAILGLITPVKVVGSGEYIRMTGLYSNPNALGFSMWYGATAVVLFLLHLGRKSFWQLIGIGVIALFLYVLLQSGSRKNALAFLAFGFILAYYLVRSKYRSWIISLGVLTIFTYYLFDFEKLEQTALFARTSGENLERGGEIRWVLIQEGWQMFLSKPLIGIGLGSFTSFSSSHLMAHNDFIEVIASTGLIGFLLYAPIYWFFYRQNITLLKYDKTYRLGAWLQAFLAGFLVLGMGRPTFLDPVAMLVLAFFHSLSWHKTRQLKAQFHYLKKQSYAHLPHHQHA